MWQEVCKGASSWGHERNRTSQVHNPTQGELGELNADQQSNLQLVSKVTTTPIPRLCKSYKLLPAGREKKNPIKGKYSGREQLGRRERSLERGGSWDHTKRWTQSPSPSMQKGQLWGSCLPNKSCLSTLVKFVFFILFSLSFLHACSLLFLDVTSTLSGTVAFEIHKSRDCGFLQRLLSKSWHLQLLLLSHFLLLPFSGVQTFVCPTEQIWMLPCQVPLTSRHK